MPDVRTMFEKEFLYAFDLDGRDVIVTIDAVSKGEVTGDGGKKAKKPVVTFKGHKKKLALNITNCKAIAGMYGFKTEDWIGKQIAIYPTTTTFGSETKECIRVRPTIPRATGQRAPQQPAADDMPEPGSNG